MMMNALRAPQTSPSPSRLDIANALRVPHVIQPTTSATVINRLEKMRRPKRLSLRTGEAARNAVSNAKTERVKCMGRLVACALPALRTKRLLCLRSKAQARSKAAAKMVKRSIPTHLEERHALAWIS